MYNTISYFILRNKKENLQDWFIESVQRVESFPLDVYQSCKKMCICHARGKIFSTFSKAELPLGWLEIGRIGRGRESETEKVCIQSQPLKQSSNPCSKAVL